MMLDVEIIDRDCPLSDIIPVTTNDS